MFFSESAIVYTLIKATTYIFNHLLPNRNKVFAPKNKNVVIFSFSQIFHLHPRGRDVWHIESVIRYILLLVLQQ